MSVQDTQSVIPKTQKFHSCNVRMIPAKLAYLTRDGFNGSFIPFYYVFLTSVGLSVTEAGFICGIKTIPAMIAGPLWGLLADYTGRRKMVLLILCFGILATIFPLPFVASKFAKPEKNLTISDIGGNNATNQPQYYHVGKRFTETVTNDVMKNTVSRQIANIATGSSDIPKKAVPKNFSSNLFYVMMVFVFTSEIFLTPLIGVLDSLVMNVIETSETETSFGEQRVYGAFAFGLINFIAGFVADHYQPPGLSKYAAVFYVFLAFLLLFIPIVLILFSQTKWQTSITESQINMSKTRRAISTFCVMDNFVYLSTVFIVGMANMIHIQFLFLFMRDYMQSSGSIMGFAILVASVATVMMFIFSKNAVHFFGGPVNCMEIVLLSYVVRFTLVSYIKNPWLVVPLQAMNGFCFSLFWPAAVEHAQLISPTDIYVTIFSIVSSVYFNVGGITASFVGSFLYAKYGGIVMLRSEATICFIYCIFMLIYFERRPVEHDNIIYRNHGFRPKSCYEEI